jgi:hypothetical protein
MAPKNVPAGGAFGIKNRYFSAGLLFGGPLLVLAPFLVHFGGLWASFCDHFNDFGPLWGHFWSIWHPFGTMFVPKSCSLNP